MSELYLTGQTAQRTAIIQFRSHGRINIGSKYKTLHHVLVSIYETDTKRILVPISCNKKQNVAVLAS